MSDNHDTLSGGTSRRLFLKQLGLGSSALLFGLMGGLSLPQDALAVCEPLGAPGAPKRWRRDCRPIRPRRPASTLTNDEIEKLRNAYQAMRALDASDPNDPRGFKRQANIHCWYCGEGTQVHFSWQFFAWHRAYLYFHERILGKLIGDMEFRLPYWDWENTAHRRMPGAYTSPNDATNPLWHTIRDMGPTDEIPDEDVGDLVMEAALTAETFAEFGGTATTNGIPENAPHGSVHVDVGGDMGFFDTAARDPIFYAHHGNVDKIWSDWNKASSTHTNPVDPTFLTLTWNFYDENKVWRSITAAQVLNHENQLRYTYGSSKFIENLPCLLDWVRIRTKWRELRTLQLAADVHKKMAQATERGGRTRLHLIEMPVPLDKSAIYRLYISPETAKQDEGPTGEGYLGAFPVVLNNREKRHQPKRTRNVTLNMGEKALATLARSQAAQRLTFVERGTKERGRKMSSVQAADVYFTVADVER